ncbi:FkbM family methyltransferase [Rhizobium sp. TH2]|uniref:FkbM family methyltransferase n=1 Tax=Rhizobium sp. TH2 TaxID=2775403 RepID=UPI002157E7A9|nr:FkbM family methyltransferase [Rhizobium sp. TH2]UVC11958.1 FkbM family methyltransferase [Rhizobium sp. TH2]
MFRRLRDRLASRFFDTRYGRDLLIKAIGARTRFITVDNGDHLITFSPADYLGRSVFVKGHFDRDHVDRLMRHLNSLGLSVEGKTLLEIGGNIGTHTIYFALTGAFGRIVTIEPDPRNFELLAENITQNGFDELVVPINCAASDIEGQIDFFLHPSNHGKSSPNSRSAADIKMAVPARPVPAILAGAGIAEADVGLVWMDIEGYEPIACRSMTSLFERHVPVHSEFTSEFYGAEKAAEFVAFLAGYYDDCLVFFNDDSMARIKVVDIPVDREQFDILLIP